MILIYQYQKSENKKWHAGLTMKRAFDGANNEFGACLKIKCLRRKKTLVCFDPRVLFSHGRVISNVKP